MTGLCRHCGVQVRLVECADGYDRWMHFMDMDGTTFSYLECRFPHAVAYPELGTIRTPEGEILSP